MLGRLRINLVLRRTVIFLKLETADVVSSSSAASYR